MCAGTLGDDEAMRRYVTPRFLARSALIAALYAALTLAVAPLSYGIMQVRVAEALCVLPYFTASAVPGLFVGCLVANGVGVAMGLGAGLPDIVFGSMATLAAALLTRAMRRRYLAPLPPVVVNAFVIGPMLHAALRYPLLAAIAWVGLGQLVACYGLGVPLMLLLERHRERLFGAEP